MTQQDYLTLKVFKLKNDGLLSRRAYLNCRALLTNPEFNEKSVELVNRQIVTNGGVRA